MLFLMASFHAKSHKHSDCLSFVWQEYGQYILIDSGKYGYKSDEMRRYFQSTRSHNTIEIDGEDFSRAVRHAYGSGMRRVTPVGRTWLIDAEADRPYAGTTHRRCVFLRPGKFVLAIDHIVTTGTGRTAMRLSRRHEFTNWWHFDPSLTLVSEKRAPVVGV